MTCLGARGPLDPALYTCSSRAIVVALQTVWSAAAGRPWDLRTLRAYMDWLQEAITLSTWLDARKSSMMVMPRMSIDLTLLIPERGGGSSFPLLLMIISLVFAALSRRLLLGTRNTFDNAQTSQNNRLRLHNGDFIIYLKGIAQNISYQMNAFILVHTLLYTAMHIPTSVE